MCIGFSFDAEVFLRATRAAVVTELSQCAFSID